MINLVTVVGKNTHLLPHMLKHYENMVDKIYVVVYRQDENDGILEEIKELGIEPYLVVTEPKYNWNKVTELYNFVKRIKRAGTHLNGQMTEQTATLLCSPFRYPASIGSCS